MPSEQLDRVIEVQSGLLGLMASATSTDEARIAIRDYLLAAYDAPLPDDVEVEDVDANGVSARWLRPPGVDRGAVILYFHGGGYMMGTVEDAQETLAAIGRAAGVSVLAVRYRLAPEHAFPAAIDDAVAAYRYLVDSGVAPERIIPLGDSVGGGMSLALLLRLRDEGNALPGAAVALSPFADFAGEGATMVSNADRDVVMNAAVLEMVGAAYLQGADVRHPYASPLYGNLTGLPPILLQVGTAEALLDDSLRLAARGLDHGVDVSLETWADMAHQWHFYPWLPEAQEARAKVATFVRQHIGSIAEV